MAAAKFLQWAMFWTFEKRISSIMFKSCVCRCPIPGLLGKDSLFSSMHNLTVSIGARQGSRFVHAANG